jgi:hypothetical protein
MIPARLNRERIRRTTTGLVPKVSAIRSEVRGQPFIEVRKPTVWRAREKSMFTDHFCNKVGYICKRKRFIDPISPSLTIGDLRNLFRNGTGINRVNSLDLKSVTGLRHPLE